MRVRGDLCKAAPPLDACRIVAWTSWTAALCVFNDVGGVGMAGACDVCAGVGCAAEAAGWCGLVSISECEFPVI